MSDHAGRSRRLASSVQHHPLRAVACDWPALLVCFAAPCMSRIPRGAKGEDHDYHRHHSGFDQYRCHLSHAQAQRRRLRLGGRRPVASAQAACIGSASALVAPMLHGGQGVRSLCSIHSAMVFRCVSHSQPTTLRIRTNGSSAKSTMTTLARPVGGDLLPAAVNSPCS